MCLGNKLSIYASLLNPSTGPHRHHARSRRITNDLPRQVTAIKDQISDIAAAAARTAHHGSVIVTYLLSLRHYGLGQTHKIAWGGNRSSTSTTTSSSTLPLSRGSQTSLVISSSARYCSCPPQRWCQSTSTLLEVRAHSQGTCSRLVLAGWLDLLALRRPSGWLGSQRVLLY